MSSRSSGRSADSAEAQLMECRRENGYLLTALEAATDKVGELSEKALEDADLIQDLKEQVKNLHEEKKFPQKAVEFSHVVGGLATFATVSNVEEQALLARHGYVAVGDIPEFKALSRVVFRDYIMSFKRIQEELDKIEEMEDTPDKKIEVRKAIEKQKKASVGKYLYDREKAKEQFLIQLKQKHQGVE